MTESLKSSKQKLDEELRIKLGINPNYKGRISKYVKKSPRKYTKKEHVNKYKEFLENPIKVLEEKNKNLNEYIKNVRNTASKQVEQLKNNVFSDRYKLFIKQVDNSQVKTLSKVIPLILLSLTVLFIKNKGTLQHVKTVYDLSVKTLTEKLNENNTGAQIDPVFMDKAKEFIHAYIKTLSDSRMSLDSIASIFALLALFIDDIPNIFMKDYTNVQDLGLIQLIRRLTGNVAEAGNIFVKPVKEKEGDLMQFVKGKDVMKREISDAVKRHLKSVKKTSLPVIKSSKKVVKRKTM